MIGADHVSTDPADLVCYSYDSTTARSLPSAVVHPATATEIARLLVLARNEGIAITPRGSGTGLSGGSIPLQGSIVLHLDRLNSIRTIDVAEMLAVVEPGVINRDLRQAVEARGLFYPPDPSSTRICTLGGNVAENSGGPRGVKYGVTGDYVIGLEAVLASGRIIKTGGVTRRNVTGYDLTSLLVGSEGTLAVITEITLRLLPKPRTRSAALMAFPSLEEAGAAIQAISAEGLVPSALEIMDRVAIECVESYRPGRLPHDAEAVLLVEVDGDELSVGDQLKRAVAACQSRKGRLAGSADGDAATEELWESRRMISPALTRMAPARIGEDISVPRASIPTMLERLQEIGFRYGLTIAVFGHAGDGNLHPNILTDVSDPEKMARTDAAIAEIFTAALDLGGTLSGEHGIGLAKARFMKDALGDEMLALMKGVKQVFDPDGILNPGKIF